MSPNGLIAEWRVGCKCMVVLEGKSAPGAVVPSYPCWWQLSRGESGFGFEFELASNADNCKRPRVKEAWK